MAIFRQKSGLSTPVHQCHESIPSPVAVAILLTVGYRTSECILDLIAFRRVRRRANFVSQQRAAEDNNQWLLGDVGVQA
jgi:hypothetical protein